MTASRPASRKTGSRLIPGPAFAVVVTAAIALLWIFVPGAAAQDDPPINLANEMHNSPVSTSAARVLKWLADGGDPNIAIDTDANTLVHHAATNFLHLLRAVVEAGGGCRRNTHGASPLHFAATQTALGPGPDSIRLLAWCDADERDSRGNTPLHTVYEGVVRRTPSLIRNLGETLLPDSGGGGRTDIAKALLEEADADPNIRNGEGDAPIMMVVRRRGFFDKTGHLKLLLAHGADPDTRNAKGETPLFAALALPPSTTWDTGTKDAIRLLLAGGADPNLRSPDGDTPLIRAAKHEDDAAIDMDALLRGGADPCLRDARGHVAYDYTAEDSEGRLLLEKAGGHVDRDTGLCARELAEAQAAENEIGLGRDQRRKLQSCLKTQGFDPGKPDGIFGRNTRSKIRAWQVAAGQSGKEAAGFLSAADVEELTTRCYVARSPECTGNPSDTPNGCWMKVEGGANCHVWNPNPAPEETATWNGRCVDGLISGRGRVTWRFRKDGQWRTSWNENEYREGRIQDGPFRARLPDGTLIEGTRKDGRWHGHGTETYSNGEFWEGPFVNGKYHGVWVKHASGELVANCWQHGKRVDLRACGRAAADRRMQAEASLSLRRGPGDAYSAVVRLGAEEEVQVTAEFGEWAWVESEGSGQSGFVRKTALMPAAPAAPVAVLEPKCAGASERAECWEALTNKPGCHVWVGYFHPGDTLTWSGACVAGVADGPGKLIWNNYGKKLREETGTLSGGKQQGSWVARDAGGDTAEGPYVDGKVHGRWVQRWADGSCVVLDYSHGDFVGDGQGC